MIGRPLCPTTSKPTSSFCCREGCSCPAFLCQDDYQKTHSSCRIVSWDEMSPQIDSLVQRSKHLQVSQQVFSTLSCQVQTLIRQLSDILAKYQAECLRLLQELDVQQELRESLVELEEGHVGTLTGDQMSRLLGFSRQSEGEGARDVLRKQLEFQNNRMRLLVDNIDTTILGFRKGNNDVVLDNKKMLQEKADKLRWCKNYQEAVEAYTAAIVADPTNAKLYHDRAQCYCELKQYAKALEDETEAIKIKPLKDAFYFVRGDAYRHMKQYQKAIEQYTESLKINPKSSTCYNNRGLCYYRLKDYKKALQNYQKATCILPGYAIAFANKGDAYYCLKEYHKAIAQYSKAIQLNPQEAGFYKWRANALDKVDQADEARADREKQAALLAQRTRT